MPVNPRDSVEKECYYPDDLADGVGFVIREFAFWDASDDDDAEELPDNAQYGFWLPVSPMSDKDVDAWLSAPRALREDLVDNDAEEGSSFRVLEIAKGEADHAPYSVEIEIPYKM